MPPKLSETEVPIGFLAVLSIFLVVLGNIMIGKGRFPIGVYTLDLVICGVFAWDSLKRLWTSASKREFWRRSRYEPLAMVPAIALHALAGLRALRLVRFGRTVLVASRLRRTFSLAGRFVQHSQFLYSISCSSPPAS